MNELEEICCQGNTKQLRELLQHYSDRNYVHNKNNNNNNRPNLSSSAISRAAKLTILHQEGVAALEVLQLLHRTHESGIISVGADLLHSTLERHNSTSVQLIVPWLLQILPNVSQFIRATNSEKETVIDVATRKAYQNIVNMMEEELYSTARTMLDNDINSVSPQKDAEKSAETKEKVDSCNHGNVTQTEDDKNGNKTKQSDGHVDMLQAARERKWSLVTSLLRDGANVNVTDASGCGLAHILLTQAQREKPEYILNKLDMLVKYNLDLPTALSKENDGLINIAVKKIDNEDLCLKVVKVLINLKVPAHQRDLDGRTAIDIAKLRQYKEVVQLLQDVNQFDGPYHQVHIICRDKNKSQEQKITELENTFFSLGGYKDIRTKPEEETCLHIACRLEEEKVVRYLLDKERNCTVNLVNKEGKSSLDITQQETKNKAIEEMLLEAAHRQGIKSKWQETAQKTRKPCVIL